MGAIYRPKYRDRNGEIREAAVWWVRFRQHGKTVRQSTETTSEPKAKRFLRERALLRRMGSLARHQCGLVVPFEVTTFQERNARKGFFERDAFDAVCAHLRPELAAIAQAAYLTGWRKSELRSRQWPHVDFAA